MTKPSAARFGDLSPEDQADWNRSFAKAQDNISLGGCAMTKPFELPEPEILCDCGGNYFTAAQVTAAVNQALEEAAKVAENTYEGSNHGPDGESGYDFMGENSAAAIRSMKRPT